MTEPIHIISLGAGVQSSTMALMAACGEITPMPKCAIFADTQDEPRAVYDWLKWIVQKLPFTVYQVTAGKLSENLLTFKVTEDDLPKRVFLGSPEMQTVLRGKSSIVNVRRISR